MKRIFSVFLILSFILTGSYSFAQTSVINTIVLDAGHGGKDPGCHGGYAHEKDVCLSMALKLGKLINQKFPEVKVIYTRNDDRFIELYQRAEIANKSKADLNSNKLSNLTVSLFNLNV